MASVILLISEALTGSVDSLFLFLFLFIFLSLFLYLFVFLFPFIFIVAPKFELGLFEWQYAMLATRLPRPPLV